TATYRRLREGIRAYYRDHYPLLPAARADPRLNPGQGMVSALCHEPRVGLAVLEAMLAPYRAGRQLEVRLHQVPLRAEMDGDRVRAVIVRDAQTGDETVL